jgi:hypothetical protein
MGFFTMKRDGDNPADPGAPPPPETLASGSIRQALPRTGELSAGEANDEVAPNAGDGVFPTAEIPIHLSANLIPMDDEARLREMARDMGERGQLEPIVLYQEQILDGRCRYRGCLSAEVVPKVEKYEGCDLLGYVISRNIHRRHLLKDSQRALVAARLATLLFGANEYSEGVSIDTACNLLKVTSTAVKRAKKILIRGIPDVVKAVEDGSLTLWKALWLAKLRNSEQRAEMDRLAGNLGRSRKHAAVAQTRVRATTVPKHRREHLGRS